MNNKRKETKNDSVSNNLVVPADPPGSDGADLDGGRE